MLIFFIHHVATSIQLPQVIASIAGDLSRRDRGRGRARTATRRRPPKTGPGAGRADRRASTARAPRSPRLRAATCSSSDIRRWSTSRSHADAVIELLYRPGHFVVEGLPLAKVWPAAAAPEVARGLARAHATGAHRTLAQDLAFAIDQLEEIAIRALSPAVNDTFTASTCIDWLGDGLCKISARWNPDRIHRDAAGRVRVIAAEAVYSRLVDRAFDKIRQAGRGMPAVMIRQLDSIAQDHRAYATTEEQRDVLSRQADMIWRSSCEAVPEPDDRADVERSYDIAARGPAGSSRRSKKRLTERGKNAQKSGDPFGLLRTKV